MRWVRLTQRVLFKVARTAGTFGFHGAVRHNVSGFLPPDIKASIEWPRFPVSVWSPLQSSS